MKPSTKRRKRKPMPTVGWSCTDVTDLTVRGDPTGTCEFCGKTGLRFIFHLLHDKWHAQLDVGCECASHLADGLTIKQVNQWLRNLADRRDRWLNRPWYRNRKNNLCLRTDGFVVTVFPDRFAKNAFSVSLHSRSTTEFSPAPYPTVDEAKLAAFDRLADLLEW